MANKNPFRLRNRKFLKKFLKKAKIQYNGVPKIAHFFDFFEIFVWFCILCRPILRIRAILKTVNLWPTTVHGPKFVDVSADLTPLNCELFLCDFIHILLNFDFSFFQCSCQSKTSMFQIMNIISFFISFKIHQSELELSLQWELKLSSQPERE